jgi:hypothetical protein
MSRSRQIGVFVLIGVIGLVLAGWAGYACVTMQPDGTYVMRATDDESDDGAFAICSFHPSLSSYVRRGSLGLGALAGAFVAVVAASSLRHVRKHESDT